MQIKKVFWKESRRRSAMEQLKETEKFMRSCIFFNFMKEARCLKCKYSLCFVHAKSENSIFLNHERIVWRRYIQRFDIVRMWWKIAGWLIVLCSHNAGLFFQQTQVSLSELFNKKKQLSKCHCHMINARTLNSLSRWEKGTAKN